MFETICDLLPGDPEYPARARILDILKRVLDGTLYDVLPYQFHEERSAGGIIFRSDGDGRVFGMLCVELWSRIVCRCYSAKVTFLPLIAPIDTSETFLPI